jgi:uncharacterized protein (TIRG00374 family)
MNIRRATKIVVFIVLTMACIWLLRRLDWSDVARRLSGASVPNLVGMTVAWLAALLLRPLRFKYLLGRLGYVEGVRYRTIWAALILGAAVNSFTPMRAGDAAMAIFLRQRLGMAVHRTFTVIVTDWICDFTCVALAFIGALTFAPTVVAWAGHTVTLLVGFLVLGVLGFAAVLLFHGRFLAMLNTVLSRIAPKKHQRIIEIVGEIFTGFAALGTWRVGAPLALFSALIWGLTWLSYWFGIGAVFAAANPAAAAFGMAASTLSFAIPLGPGGLGTFEASTTLALAVFNVPLEAAIPFAIIAHALQLGSLAVLIALAIVTRQIDFRSIGASGRATQD